MTRNFEGETPDIGDVISIHTEQLDNGDTFDVFQEKLKTLSVL